MAERESCDTNDSVKETDETCPVKDKAIFKSSTHTSGRCCLHSAVVISLQYNIAYFYVYIYEFFSSLHSGVWSYNKCYCKLVQQTVKALQVFCNA